MTTPKGMVWEKIKNPNAVNPDNLNIRFAETSGGELAVVNDRDSRAVLENTPISGKSFREKLDEFVRELAAEKARDFGVDDIIKKELGRRVEVAVKLCAPTIEREAQAAVTEMIRKRVAALASTIRLEISVSAATAIEPMEESR